MAARCGACPKPGSAGAPSVSAGEDVSATYRDTSPVVPGPGGVARKKYSPDDVTDTLTMPPSCKATTIRAASCSLTSPRRRRATRSDPSTCVS